MQEEQLQRINNKVQQLLKRFDALQKENSRLKNTLETLQSEKTSCDEKMKELELRIEVLKATKSNMGEEEKKSLDKKINQYVKEIDRCISSLKT